MNSIIFDNTFLCRWLSTRSGSVGDILNRVYFNVKAIKHHFSQVDHVVLTFEPLDEILKTLWLDIRYM